MRDLVLHRATPADSEFAYEVKKAAFRHHVEALWGWDEDEQRRLHEKRFSSQECRIVEESGDRVGILSLAREPDGVFVKQLFLLPEHQGRGAGEAVMRRVIADAARDDLPVRLSVLKINERAATFFRRLGFRRTGETDTHHLFERPAAEDPTEIVRRGYDLVSEAYRPDDGGEESARYEPWLAALGAELAPGSRILELGCGCGIPVARDLSRDHDVTGIDLSEVQIARARRLAPAALFRREDMTEARFPPESFDAVVALYSLIHVPLDRQPDLLRRMTSWLRPAGLLLLTTGSSVWTGTEESWLGVDGATMFWSHADPETYREWLREHGLRVLREWSQPEGEIRHPVFLARKADA